MESIDEDMQDISEDIKDGKNSNQESTKNIKKAVQRNVTGSTESIKNDMKEILTRFIEKTKQMKKCCLRESNKNMDQENVTNLDGELYLVGFVLDSA